jgi:DNA-binding IclR family transcriptional regulator
MAPVIGVVYGWGVGMQNSDIKEYILDLLSERNYGLTIEEVASFLEVNRSTASKYLAVMQAEGKVHVREVGKAKLHYQRTTFGSEGAQPQY